MAFKKSIVYLLLSAAAVDQSIALARGRKDGAFVAPPATSGLAIPSQARSATTTSRISANSHVDVFQKPTPGRSVTAYKVASDVSGGAVSVPKPAEPSSGVTVGRSIFNLIKNVVGAGILAIPGGVTAFSQSRAAVVPTVAMIVALGGMSGYCFSLIGRVCAATGASSYGDAWGRTIGAKTSWLPTGSCTAKTFFACMAYSIIIGDVFADVLTAFGAPGILAARTNILCLVSTGVLLPLCLLKDLSALSYTSILGVLGTVYTAVVMGIRFFDKSYVEGGRFFAGLAEDAKPVFSGTGAMNSGALILVSMLSTAFVAHFNAPKFYADLKDKSVPRYNAVVGTSFATAIGLVVIMTLFPYLTFGGASKSFILNNFATTDRLATSCRLAIATSIVGGYPLVFLGAKTGAMSAFGYSNPTETQRKIGTTLLLAFFTAIGVLLTDLGFVVSFGGAVLGSALVFIFPTMMWISKCKKDTKMGRKLKGWRKAEVTANYIISGLGVALAVLGGGLSVKKSFF
eukprot:g8617.t1